MSLLFLLASLGVINGFFVGLYLLARRQRNVSDTYFAGLLIALCIRIGKSVYYYFSREVDLLILQIGLSACILIGPFFYYYLKSIYYKQEFHKRQDLGVVMMLLITIIVIGILFPYRSRPEVWTGYIIYGIYSIWGLFTLGGLYFGIKTLGSKILTFWKMDTRRQYLLVVMWAMLFITSTYLFALFFGYTYIWGALIFSFSFYYLGFRALMRYKVVSPRAQLPKLPNAQELLNQLDQFMSTEKPFRDQSLKLDQLATMANLSRHTLSRILNETYDHGYAHYIKRYRVEEAKRLIADSPHLSLEGIGYEAGFNSKSTFFEAFKKIAKCTPAEFKNSLESTYKD